MTQIDELKARGLPVAFIGDVVGTGSSRKSATNSVLWFFGEDMPGVPNKRSGGICFGSKVAPIFFNTMEDAGALVFEAPVDNIANGDVITSSLTRAKFSTKRRSGFRVRTQIRSDSRRSSSRWPYQPDYWSWPYSACSRAHGPATFRRLPSPHCPIVSDAGFTLAQKMVGKACGVEGIRPGTYCEPKMTTVGSQDTTGP